MWDEQECLEISEAELTALHAGARVAIVVHPEDLQDREVDACIGVFAEQTGGGLGRMTVRIADLGHEPHVLILASDGDRWMAEDVE